MNKTPSAFDVVEATKAPAIEAVEVAKDVTADVTLVASGKAPDVGTPEFEKYIQDLRGKRKPYGDTMQKLAYPPRSGYKRHWFNDIGGRVQDYLDAGWSQVIDPKGQPVKRNVGSKRDNSALAAYLLEIPSVFWEEIEEERRRIAAARMDELKKSPIRAPAGSVKSSDREKFYSPKEEMISVSETLSRSR